jgi:hypothetical protein
MMASRLYVRQSTAPQVKGHQERHAAAVWAGGTAVVLGWWAPSRVLMIDEDLGHSAPGAGTRPGASGRLGKRHSDRVSRTRADSEGQARP